MCGADAVGWWFGFGVAGSPPRVRSRPYFAGVPNVQVGITSACAEQTDDLLGYSLRVGITSACAEQTR